MSYFSLHRRKKSGGHVVSFRGQECSARRKTGARQMRRKIMVESKADEEDHLEVESKVENRSGRGGEVEVDVCQ